MNEKLRDNLKKLMLRHGNMSVSDLARATHLPQPTLYQLYTGVTSRPRKKTLSVLAKYFSVTTEQLLGKEVLPYTLPPQLKDELELKSVPILAWKDLHERADKVSFSYSEEILLEREVGQDIFALRMVGSTMEPIFPEGCLLIFDRDKKLKNGGFGLIYSNKNHQFYFKKIFLEQGIMYAKSIQHEPDEPGVIKLTTQESLVAVLLEARLVF